jgi:hypothetical protein
MATKEREIRERYRTKLLDPVTISVRFVKEDFYYAFPYAQIDFYEGRSHYGLVLRLQYFELEDYPEDKRERMEQLVLDEIVRFAKWLVINGTFRSWDIEKNGIVLKKRAGHSYHEAEVPRMLMIVPVDRTTDKFDFQFDDRDGNWTILHPPLRRVDLEEHQLARRIVLGELYKQPQSVERLIEMSHFPPHVVRQELDGLAGSGFVAVQKVVGSHEYTYSLNHTGRELYEKSMTFRSGVVFIIAACDNPERRKQGEIIEVYKKAIRDRSLEPIFQEHEEPHKNIYVDIFDYIDSCEFVVADITHERADCFVEIGYALARQKRVLLFVEENCLKEMRDKNRFPFDLSLVKYHTYSRDRLDLLSQKCSERIRIVQEGKSSV